MSPIPEQKPKLLWLDLARNVRAKEEYDKFFACFSILRCHCDDISDDDVRTYNPDAILCEYDYPDRAGLDTLKNTKKRFPSIPVFMLTEQHSESLAVWALRARVLDYLVKPVENAKIAKLSSDLAVLRRMRDDNSEQRQPANSDEAVPYEARIGAYIASANSVKRAANYIDKNLKDKIQAKDLASLCNMDTRNFSCAFKKAYGLSFQRYHFQRRMEEAARLLCHPDANICDVAYTLGFRDPSYFTRNFKSFFDCTPRQFREALIKQNFKFSEQALEQTIQVQEKKPALILAARN